MVAPPTRKPRVLRRKNIKKKTGATSQAKQIAALAKQVSSLTKRSWNKCATRWIRDSQRVETIAGGTYAYICPIPYSPNNATGSGSTQTASAWTDNLSLPSQPNYFKEMVFGISEGAQNSNDVYHTGGKIKWQMTNTEPTLTKLGLFLIRPKRKMADQIVKDRLLKQGSASNPTPGFAGFLNDGLDYIVHKPLGTSTSTCFGSQINTKYFDVLYKREVTLGHPHGQGFAGTVYGSNTQPADNAMIATGSIKIPAGGLCKYAGVVNQTGTNPEANGWELDYKDQKNEESCYLVCINNGVAIDGETVNLGFMVTDYYKASV